MKPAKETDSTPESDNSGDIKKISENQDSIKLNKNSKGYTWELKRYYDFGKTRPEEVIAQLEQINNTLQKKFGGQND